MNLGEMLAAKKDRVLQRWTETVRGGIDPAATPRLEIIDHLPSFLDEVARALCKGKCVETSEIAAEHGVQRFALGFSLDAVVREYGALYDAIVEEAAAAAVATTTEERDALTGCVITGIADAVSEYQRQRDAEQQRQANEHFAFVAHELRNPLGSALTALSLLLSRGKISDKRLADILHRSLRRMSDLIEASLRVARLGNSIAIQPTKVMLRRLLVDVEASASAEAEAKGVELRVDVEGDLELFVDTRLVHSALTNLVRNAVKFTHEGGSVQIRAKRERSCLLIEVEDRCGGLPPGAAEKAFVPFAQMGSDRTGFGLGLPIAKQAADAHGGTIRIQNLPGKGCIFALELPMTT
jgi:signal transduction histidine kinase